MVMETKEKFSSSKDVVAFLSETFPKCFSVDGDAKPLKVGIFQDVVERLADETRLSKTLLRSTLRHYTNSWRYLHSVKEGAYRVDLDGNQCVQIEKEHAEHALKVLKESKEKVAQVRKQKNAENKGKFTKPKVSRKPSSDKKPSNRPVKPKAKVVTEKLSNETTVVGASVSVKVGKAPMQAVITEVAKDGVYVQLNSGMVMKVQADNLRLVK